MDQLHLDFETRSELELDERGLDNYARHPSTEVLMLAWAINDGKVNLWQPHVDGPMPGECLEALKDPWVTAVGWNATFERTILKWKLDIWKPYEEWVDPMINARHLSMPGKLDDVGRILKLSQDEAKIGEGKRLIKLFCSAAVPSLVGGLFGDVPAAFRDWTTDPKDWELFCEYCKQDVVAERAIQKKLVRFPLPDCEQKLWELDQEVCDAGLPVDMDLVRGARHVTERELGRLRAELKELTHLENPNSNEQMLAWVQDQGYTFGALGKPFVARAFAGECSLTPAGRKALEIRAMTSKSAVHKFTAIADNVSEDGRIRNQFVFAGAARTSRWSGRDCQPQNFPRPTKEVEKNMDRAVELLRAGDYDAIVREFSFPLDVVTSCARAALRAPDGFHFVVCDLSSIENIVLGWLSGCDAILKVFREGRDPYKDFAVDMYGKSYEDVTKEERQNSKPAVLGCGYQLSGGEEVENSDGDIVRTGLWGYAKALGVELTREEAHRSVQVFRTKFPEVVDFWRDTEEAAIRAVRTKEDQVVGKLVFRATGARMLQTILPSGRPLNYINPRVEQIDPNKIVEEVDGVENGEDSEATASLLWENKVAAPVADKQVTTKKAYTKTSLSYEGANQKTRQWTRIYTYGGKHAENDTQAVVPDILAHGMVLAHKIGFSIVGHVHDELITLVRNGSPLGIEDLRGCMRKSPPWAPDLELGAAGYESMYYKKE